MWIAEERLEAIHGSVANLQPLAAISAQTQQPVSEGFTTHRKLGGKQSDESEHGHAAVELFCAFVESPTLLNFNDFHAGFRSEGVQTSAVFGGDGGTADHGGRSGLSHDAKTLDCNEV